MQDSVPLFSLSVTQSSTDLNTKFSSYQLPKIKVALSYNVFVSLFYV